MKSPAVLVIIGILLSACAHKPSANTVAMPDAIGGEEEELAGLLLTISVGSPIVFGYSEAKEARAEGA